MFVYLVLKKNFGEEPLLVIFNFTVRPDDSILGSIHIVLLGPVLIERVFYW